MTERLGYKHVHDFLNDQSSEELTGWFEYLRIDDEVQIHKLVYSIVRAFNGDGSNSNSNKNKKQQEFNDEEDDEVIDTTAPEFLDNFKGFSNTPRNSQAPMQMQHHNVRNTGGTEILFG